MKNADLHKKANNCDYQKRNYLFMIVMSNNTPETMTRQQRYHEENR